MLIELGSGILIPSILDSHHKCTHFLFWYSSQYLLSKKGYDTEKLQVKLSRVELKDSFEPIEPLHETDLEGYLQHEQEMLLLTAIEEAKKEVRIARKSANILNWNSFAFPWPDSHNNRVFIVQFA